MRNARRYLNGLFALPFITAIMIYQRTLSPDHGLMNIFFPYGACRHTPTCSQYALQQLHETPLPIALGRIVRRVLSCNPWKKLSEKKLRELTSTR